MGVYQITYAPQIKEVCLYFDGDCNFRCHGCINKYHPNDIHLNCPSLTKSRKISLSHEQVISLLDPLHPQKVIFLGQEPTTDHQFISLAEILKEKLLTHNILLTNGWKYVDNGAIDEVCVSIKAVSKTLFKDFTGRDNPDRVLANFQKYALNPLLEIRAESIFIPNYIDYKEIDSISRFIANVDANIPYRIDAYIPFPMSWGKDKFRSPTQQEMKIAKKIAEKHLRQVSILTSKTKVKYQVERIF